MRSVEEPSNGDVELTVNLVKTGAETFEYEMIRDVSDHRSEGSGVISPTGRLLAPDAELSEGILVDGQIESYNEITWIRVEVFEPQDSHDLKPDDPKKHASITHLTRTG